MDQYQLAQLNTAKMKYGIDDPKMSDFVDQLDSINALADSAPGFVWRLITEEGDVTAMCYFGSDILVNMSVWQDVESLFDYVYQSSHNRVMSQRQKWFDRIEEAYSVLWWVPFSRVPTLQEASERLQCLIEQGPSEKAFTFKQRFPPP